MKILLTKNQNDKLLEQINSIPELVNEEFMFHDLTPEEQDKLYEIFKTSYEKSTGASWDRYKFNSRAQGWTFFGDKNEGYVAVRKQRSGFVKLAGVSGSFKGIGKGMDELIATNAPIWGLMPERLGNILVMKYGFIKPPAWLFKLIMKSVPANVLGNVDFKINKDGSLTLDYQDVGPATKFFVGNKQYFMFLLKNMISSGTAIPKIALISLKKLLGLNESEIKKKHIGDIIELLNEEITTGSVIVYHRTGKSGHNPVPGISADGYRVGQGAMYGVGVYTTYTLASQQKPNMRQSYGNIIIRSKVISMDKFVIFDMDVTKKLYGKEVPVLDQIKRILGKNFKEWYDPQPKEQPAAQEVNELVILSPEERSRKETIDSLLNMKPTFSSEIAANLWRIGNLYHYIRGVVYTGANDGNCLVSYDRQNVEPISYTTDEGITWHAVYNRNIYKRARRYIPQHTYIVAVQNKLQIGQNLSEDEIRIIARDFESFDFKQIKGDNLYEILSHGGKNIVPIIEKIINDKGATLRSDEMLIMYPYVPDKREYLQKLSSFNSLKEEVIESLINSSRTNEQKIESIKTILEIKRSQNELNENDIFWILKPSSSVFSEAIELIGKEDIAKMNPKTLISLYNWLNISPIDYIKIFGTEFIEKAWTGDFIKKLFSKLKENESFRELFELLGYEFLKNACILHPTLSYNMMGNISNLSNVKERMNVMGPEILSKMEEMGFLNIMRKFAVIDKDDEELASFINLKKDNMTNSIAYGALKLARNVERIGDILGENGIRKLDDTSISNLFSDYQDIGNIPLTPERKTNYVNVIVKHKKGALTSHNILTVISSTSVPDERRSIIQYILDTQGKQLSMDVVRNILAYSKKEDRQNIIDYVFTNYSHEITGHTIIDILQHSANVKEAISRIGVDKLDDRSLLPLFNSILETLDEKIKISEFIGHNILMRLKSYSLAQLIKSGSPLPPLIEEVATENLETKEIDNLIDNIGAYSSPEYRNRVINFIVRTKYLKTANPERNLHKLIFYSENPERIAAILGKELIEKMDRQGIYQLIHKGDKDPWRFINIVLKYRMDTITGWMVKDMIIATLDMERVLQLVGRENFDKMTGSDVSEIISSYRYYGKDDKERNATLKRMIEILGSKNMSQLSDGAASAFVGFSDEGRDQRIGLLLKYKRNNLTSKNIEDCMRYVSKEKKDQVGDIILGLRKYSSTNKDALNAYEKIRILQSAQNINYFIDKFGMDFVTSIHEQEQYEILYRAYNTKDMTIFNKFINMKDKLDPGVISTIFAYLDDKEKLYEIFGHEKSKTSILSTFARYMTPKGSNDPDDKVKRIFFVLEHFHDSLTSDNILSLIVSMPMYYESELEELIQGIEESKIKEISLQKLFYAMNSNPSELRPRLLSLIFKYKKNELSALDIKYLINGSYQHLKETFRRLGKVSINKLTPEDMDDILQGYANFDDETGEPDKSYTIIRNLFLKYKTLYPEDVMYLIRHRLTMAQIQKIGREFFKKLTPTILNNMIVYAMDRPDLIEFIEFLGKDIVAKVPSNSIGYFVQGANNYPKGEEFVSLLKKWGLA